MIAWQKDLNALVVLTITGILLGAYGVQFLWHEEPCPLCLMQRLGMIGVATAALLNIRFGIHMTHYGLWLLSSLTGGFIALRQIALHVCPGFPKFGDPVFGLSLYTWSFIVFVCCILAVAILLFMYNPRKNDDVDDEPMNGLCRFAFLMIALVTVANALTTLLQCGLGVCGD